MVPLETTQLRLCKQAGWMQPLPFNFFLLKPLLYHKSLPIGTVSLYKTYKTFVRFEMGAAASIQLAYKEAIIWFREVS